MSKRMELLARAAQRGRYSKLHEHLKNRSGDAWSVNFGTIEKILGFSLPDSARVHRPWWSNVGIKGGHSHALSWEMAGWKTSQVDLVDETLTFIRDLTFEKETSHG